MKSVILAVLAAVVSGTASARSIQLDRVCGKFHIEKVLCVTAPCPAHLYLRTEKGSLVIQSKTSSEKALKALDNTTEGTQLCISGQFQNAEKSVIGAFDVEATVADAGFICKQTINCMPIVAPENQKYCTQAYVDWSIKNCGGAPQRLD